MTSLWNMMSKSLELTRLFTLTFLCFSWFFFLFHGHDHHSSLRLVCSALYNDADGERKYLPQFFKFVVANPLSVRTKVTYASAFCLSLVWILSLGLSNCCAFWYAGSSCKGMFNILHSLNMVFYVDHWEDDCKYYNHACANYNAVSLKSNLCYWNIFHNDPMGKKFSFVREPLLF